ncbi:MAG: Omp28-related outer membrane protein [Bacteroidales bacterium]|nr:Omp28-related outer membrane protein [Bacteroidales bacterium]
MKKLTFLFICLLSVSAVFAQVTRDKVVVEVGTGTWCQYCPGAAMGVDDLIENGWPVAAIENHNGDPFTNNYSNARNSFYGISGYPTAFFDGVSSVVGGSHNESMYPSYWPKVQQRMAVPSPVTIEVWGSHTGLTYNVTVTVTKVAEINGQNIRLHLCLTESHIVYAWQGMSEVNYVDRLMVPDQLGTELDFTESDVLEIPLTFNVQSGWVLNNMELVAFVQTNSNKEIHNGYKVKLAFLVPPPPPLAASFVSDTTTCETYQVQYTDQSAGNPTGWYWEFPGGTPDTSREQNPIITYNTTGKYDVSLTVTRGTNSSTSLMEDYIDVFELPEVAFAAMEDQCINYPPVELIQGNPAGGTYSGPGVENGFFHPDVAGAGTHTLIYTYMDENSCENFAEQTVIVDACTGIPENQGVQIVTLPNPTQGTFKLSITGMEDMMNLRIINITGKTIYQKENIEVNGNFSTMIDLTGNSNGIYYIYVDGDKSSYFRKIILQR